MAPKKAVTVAEVSLVQLRNCLVNLPPSLVTILVNANTVSTSPSNVLETIPVPLFEILM